MKKCLIFLMNFLVGGLSIRFVKKTDFGFTSLSDINIIAKSVTHCASICYLTDRCIFYFYEANGKLCNIGTPVIVNPTNQQSLGWSYYESRNSENVALNKPVTTSSWYEFKPSHNPTYAVDGVIPYTSIWAVFCWHSAAETYPWLKIDLENIVDVERVVMFNRYDELGERLRDIVVRFGPTSISFPDVCGYFPGPGQTGQTVHVICQKGTMGQFLQIQLEGNGIDYHYLILCEVEVYSV